MYDNLLEVEKNKNILISYVQVTRGRVLNLFRDCMEAMFSKISQKVLFIFENFNIDLLNPNKQKKKKKKSNVWRIYVQRFSEPKEKHPTVPL